MKRIVISVISIALVLVLTIPALAESFSMSVQCTNTSDLTYSDTYGVTITKAGYLYVSHYVTDGSNTYTNLFHATKATHYLLAQKWATPYNKVPIQANTLTVGLACGIAARGNTKHYQLDGVSNITLAGTYTAQ